MLYKFLIISLYVINFDKRLYKCYYFIICYYKFCYKTVKTLNIHLETLSKLNPKSFLLIYSINKQLI